VLGAAMLIANSREGAGGYPDYFEETEKLRIFSMGN
jgi:hypothetical protein